MDINAYTAIWALVLNLIVATALTLLFRGVGQRDIGDETNPADYDERVETGQVAPVAGAPTG